MNPLLISLSLLSALSLTGTAVCLYALHRAHLLLREVDRRKIEPRVEASELDSSDIRETMTALAAQVQSLAERPEGIAEVGIPRAALNLTKRSQALRMHRRGETPQQIATALEIPRQEVELLVKVHGIVLSNV